MRINNLFQATGDGGVDPAGGSKPASRAQPSKQSGSSSDVTQLSAEGQKVQDLKVALNYVPDVRQERTGPLRESISQGTYQVNASQIADAFVNKF